MVNGDFCNLKETCCHYASIDGSCSLTACKNKQIDRIILNAPTVEAKPVRHGKWVDDKGLYRCSVCNNLWTHWWIVACPEDRMYKEMKFCPNCGAKMEKENEID